MLATDDSFIDLLSTKTARCSALIESTLKLEYQIKCLITLSRNVNFNFNIIS